MYWQNMDKLWRKQMFKAIFLNVIKNKYESKC